MIASDIHRSLLFLLGLPLYVRQAGRQAGSRALRGVMSRETSFVAQTYALSERSSSVAWDAAALTSKTDLPAVPVLPQAPA